MEADGRKELFVGSENYRKNFFIKECTRQMQVSYLGSWVHDQNLSLFSKTI